MLSAEEQAELDLLESEGDLFHAEQSAILEARKGLLAFTRYTKTDYEVNWHHEVLCAYLDAFARGDILRLMVFMPPRHGKSELVSRRLPAYMLGRNPNEQIVLSSYSASLASSMCLDVQTIMDNERYSLVFPESKILQKGMEFNGRTPRRTADFFELVRRDFVGYMKTIGVGGGLTGFGFTKAIIDDPIKNREEADSVTHRENLWKWYTSVLRTRMNSPKSGICLTLTRWHEDGLEGRLLEQMKNLPDADNWVILDLPALIDHGNKYFPRNVNDKRADMEPLWASKYDLPFLMSQRAASSRDWAALFQQLPYTEGGTIAKREWWKYYDSLPKYADQWLISVDCTFKNLDTSDYVAIQTWCRKGADKFLVDQFRSKLSFTETVKAILRMKSKYPKARTILIEDKANGSAVIDVLKNKVSGVVPYDPRASKVARAQASAPQIESGNVYLPRPENSFWINDYIDEWAKFPQGKNDDQVDCTTQALLRMEQNEGLGFRALSEL